MKNFFSIFLAVLLFAACNQDDSVPELKTVISGKITNSPTGKLYVSSGEQVNELIVNKDGMFNDTLQLAEGYYRIRYARKRGLIYISPGKDVNITADINDFNNSLKFEGEGSEANNYLTLKAAKEKEIKPDSKTLYSMEEEAFTEKIAEIKAEIINLLTETKGLSEEFIKNEKQNIEYEALSYVFNYKAAHAYFTKNEGFEQPAAFTEKIAELDLTDEENYKTFLSYQKLVDSYYSGLMGDSGEKTTEFLKAFNTLESPVIKSGIASSVAYFVKPGNDNSEALYMAIMENSGDEELKEKLTKKLELLKGLAKGQPSPDFNYKDINGNNVALKDLAGKNVYIDVWATWCGPCKAEIPYLKEMEASHHDKNIEFVSISIDKQEDMEKWEQMVEEKELKGIQLFSDKNWKSDFVKEYAIEGIPMFILVNDKGKIVSADAPRPSQKNKLLTMFAETGVR